VDFYGGFPGFRSSVGVLFVRHAHKHDLCTIGEGCRFSLSQIDGGFGACARSEDTTEHEDDEPEVKQIRPVPSLAAGLGKLARESVECADGQIEHEDRGDEEERDTRKHVVKVERQNDVRAGTREATPIEIGRFPLRNDTACNRKEREQYEKHDREFYRAQRIVDFVERRFHGTSFKTGCAQYT